MVEFFLSVLCRACPLRGPLVAVLSCLLGFIFSLLPFTPIRHSVVFFQSWSAFFFGALLAFHIFSYLCDNHIS